jgi:hypothetical protein
VAWRRLDEPGFEHARFVEDPDGLLLEGRVLGVHDGAPSEAHYVVRCGPDGTTREATVEVVVGARVGRLSLRRDEAGTWWRDGERLRALEGLSDVDVSVTPSTNTLPLRRLRLGVGESADVTAVWVGVPALAVEPLRQRYARLDEARYRYESDGGAFTATLEVDASGTVVRYGGLWERVAVAEAPSDPVPGETPADRKP